MPHLGTVMLVIGIFLSIGSGRSLARRKHDAELARRYGRRLPGLGHAAYLYMLFAFMLNTAAFVFMRIANLSLKLVLSPLEGGLTATIEAVVATLVIVVASYVFFHKRYQGVEKPLTPEGRIVLRGLDLGSKAREKTVDKLADKLRKK